MAQEVKKSLYEIAEEVSIISFVAAGREKIDTESVIKYHEEYVTIDQADVVELADKDGVVKPVAIVHIREEKDKFLFCGAVLTDRLIKICNKAVGGDFIELSRRLAEEPLKVKMFKDKNKKNITFTNIEFIK